MYPTSKEFQEKIKQQFDRRTFGKVTIDYTDPFLDQSIEVQASEQANVSYSAQTADAVSEPFAKIASLDGSWVLNGTYALAPTPQEAETKQMGWWGRQFAGTGGAFSAPYPTLTVTFLPRPITKLQAVGDSKRQEWPVDFSIRLYDGNNTLLYTETVTGNTQIAWSKTLAEPITQVEKMTLEITKWSHAGRQAKILEFFTSIQETYEDDDIIFIHLLEEREVSHGSLPVGNISSNEIYIELNNVSRKFDAGNAASPLHNLLKPNRRIQVWLGVEDVIGEWHTEIEQSSYYYQAWLCGERYVAQGFKPVGSLVGAREVWAYVVSYGKEGSPPDVHFYVYSNNEDVPGESISTDYGVVTGDNWPSRYQWVGAKIVLDEPLQEGQQYWLVLAGQGVYDRYDNVRYLYSDSDKYADGYRCTSSDGKVWIKTYDRDLTFRLDAPIYKDEWVPLGVFWSGDWSAPEDRAYAQTTGRDRLEFLRRSEYAPDTARQNISLYDLAVDILTDAGLAQEEYWVDNELKDYIIPYVGTEPQSHREALRKIAEACLGQVYCDRHGVVRVEGTKPITEQNIVSASENANVSYPAQVVDGIENPDGKYASLDGSWELDGSFVLAPGTEDSQMGWWGKQLSGSDGSFTEPYPTLTVTFIDRAIEAVKVVGDSARGEYPVGFTIRIFDGNDNLLSEQQVTGNAQVATVVSIPENPTNAAKIELSIQKWSHPGRQAKILEFLNMIYKLEISHDDYFSKDNPLRYAEVANYIVVETQPVDSNGNKLPGVKVIAKDDESITENGLLSFEFPANPLVQTVEMAEEIAGRLLEIFKDPRRNLELDWRGNPAVLLGDIVSVVDSREKNDYKVVRQEIEYDGALRARLTGRRL